jgi:hypothetical protein
VFTNGDHLEYYLKATDVTPVHATPSMPPRTTTVRVR